LRRRAAIDRKLEGRSISLVRPATEVTYRPAAECGDSGV
jgi:hypothetical protein